MTLMPHEALVDADGAYRDRMADHGLTVEAFAGLAVVAQDGAVAPALARTGPGVIPDEHRDRVAAAAVDLANAIDGRVLARDLKLARAERITGELLEVARQARLTPARPLQDRILEHVDRLAAALELEVPA